MIDNLLLYLAFVGISLTLLLVSIGAYVMITPLRELTLIREGNQAASLSLGGAALGLALALFGVSSSTFSVIELATWGGIGVVLQLLAYFIISMAIPGFRQGIESNKTAYGIASAALSIALGLINAGAIAG